MFGIVGELGCGKSVISKMIMRFLFDISVISFESEILFGEENLVYVVEKVMWKVCGN